MALILRRATRLPWRSNWQVATVALQTHADALPTPSSYRRKNPPNSSLVFASASATAAVLTWALIPSKACADFSTSTAAAVSDTLKVAVATESAVPPRGSTSSPDIVLYQYDVCPFCNKVRAYLDFHNIPYRLVEVDPLRKTELARFDASYRKVPIAIVNGTQINGSTAVIDHVSDLVYSKVAAPSELEQRWTKWLDDTFVHLIAPNIYRTAGESLQTFDYIVENGKFSAWQRGTIRYAGATAMYLIGRKLKNKYGIEDERQAIDNALKEWTDAVAEQGGFFLAGEKPGVADLSVYGVLKAIETFDTFQHVREENARLAEWFDRTKEAVGDEAVTARE